MNAKRSPSRHLAGIGSVLARRRPRLPLLLDRERSSLPLSVIHEIQHATMRYRFDGVQCLKNPFDLALYTMLISEVRPRTIVEVGSYSGGSALWFAAVGRGLRIDTRVVSVDIEPFSGLDDPDVTFVRGDVHDLGASELPQILATCARPFLVVEDGPHTAEASLAALVFFHDHLRSGEYIVIEDGIVKDLGYRRYRNGPHRAIDRFLDAHPDEYEVDRRLCDFFGHNVTWNTNGYLRRT